MVGQQTFAASVKPILADFKDTMSADREFIQFAGDSLTSEALIDELYDIYLALCADGFYSRAGVTARDIGMGYVHGLYMPCTDRVVLAGQIDLANDTIPEFSSLVLPKVEEDERGFVFVERVKKLPRGVAGIPFATHVQATTFFKPEGSSHEERAAFRELGSRSPLEVAKSYYSVTRAGLMVPCKESTEWNVRQLEAVSAYGVFAAAACAAINATTDKRFLWLVSTAEQTVSAAVKTRLELGVTAEQVKSLFYSRSLPVTETGRKRPILHWVRAHQRRLKEGIDVDIEKHLRGIERFDMGGFNFEITQPVKKPKP